MNPIVAATDQSLFREVNERIWVMNDSFDVTDEAEFLCECARRDCMHRMKLTLEEYEEVRRVPTHFAIAPAKDHIFADVERLFETHSGYWTVEMFGEAGLAATQLDPRGRNGQKDNAARRIDTALPV